MPETRPRVQTPDEVRRRLLKASAVVGGGFAIGSLPYTPPAIKSFFGTRSAFAQATSFLTLTMSGQLGTSAEGTPEDTGQDAFTFEVREANTTLTISVTQAGNLWIELGLFAPGEPVTSTNLLTGNTFGDRATPKGSDYGPRAITVASTGLYTLAIEDNNQDFQEKAGTYTITVTSDKLLGPVTQVTDEGPETLGPSG